MDTLITVLFLLCVPYIQIFLLNPLSPRSFPDVSPSLFLASLVLLSSKIPAAHSYIYAFLLGCVSSILCGHPLAFDSLSFLAIVYGVKKFSENFDMTGFGGQFVLGFASAIFHFIFLYISHQFITVNYPPFAGVLPGALTTGILLAVLFNTVLKNRKQMR
ncbi:hypothetical protein KKF70_02370 [bacterium]|nr:hypothetical protein [Candidatus Omnitrophota bacterium]MBU2528220.1 hypothetical protein [bacterium]MBU3929598.1 hypothetical protein [bacterium]MBU4122525.1 hypothetical protein [bacterium]